MPQMLLGKRILVTGGTSGLGQGIAIRAAEEGADVAFCGLTEEGADATLSAIRQAGRRGFFQAVDLSDENAARRFTRAAIDFLGGLEGLVNNAGANFWIGVAQADRAAIQRCFDVNFYSAWAVSQEAYPALKAAHGAVIVNMASIHAERTLPGVFPYNVSKAMMVALTKSQALEWGPDNIQAVALAPALIETPLAQEYFNQFPDPEAERARLISHYPLGRAGRVEDVAATAVFLLSRQNRFINGDTIFIDGGISPLMESPDK
ncbi:MAG: SDR family oxidoreductase [Caldilineae bacterium]|nr:MAG: SDR family oxidoreductase [Caldilineae bacterium]